MDIPRRTSRSEIVRDRAGYERLTRAEQEVRHRAFEAVSEMRREGTSLTAAANESA